LDHFKIQGPAQLNISGGRTSGYMLWRILQAWGGRLPPDVHALFANTGREREETLDFLHEIEVRWGVPLVWLEYCRVPGQPVVDPENSSYIGCHGHRIVNYDTADRQSGPFDAILQVKAEFRKQAKGLPPVLPNVPQRFCSGELKQRTMLRYMDTLGYDGWECVIGFRADEQHRVARLGGLKERQSIDFTAPMARAGVTEKDVLDFWKRQPFDLQLESYEGNCDFCFLKRRGVIERLMREQPHLVQKWIDDEKWTDQTYRKDRPSYGQLLESVRRPLPVVAGLFDGLEDEAIVTCFCTD
jgi:3'-phosphoadenosine 5'-phosphosulfate sulfotransferase (PAPS reductase)/FAD synthetase